MAEQTLIVLITVPDVDVGQTVADALLEQRLAACVNMIPGLRSLYWWQGERSDDQEVLLVVKTVVSLFAERLIPAVQAVHPYDVPEIIALPIIMGSQPYLDWIVSEVDAG